MTFQTGLQDLNGDYYLNLGPAAQALDTHGLLFMLNTTLMHGAGHETRLAADGDLLLFGYNDRLRQWPPDADDGVQTKWRAYRQLLKHGELYNHPGHWSGQTAGVRAKRG